MRRFLIIRQCQLIRNVCLVIDDWELPYYQVVWNIHGRTWWTLPLLNFTYSLTIDLSETKLKIAPTFLFEIIYNPQKNIQDM